MLLKSSGLDVKISRSLPSDFAISILKSSLHNFYPPPAAYWLFDLNEGPYFQSKKGAGIPIPIAMNPRRLLPHPNSSASYIYGAKSGNANPHSERRKTAAASADAAKRVYPSMMYVWMHWKMTIPPAAKMAAPMLGRIQCWCVWAVQPYLYVKSVFSG